MVERNACRCTHTATNACKERQRCISTEVRQIDPPEAGTDEREWTARIVQQTFRRLCAETMNASTFMTNTYAHTPTESSLRRAQCAREADRRICQQASRPIWRKSATGEPAPCCHRQMRHSPVVSCLQAKMQKSFRASGTRKPGD